MLPFILNRTCFNFLIEEIDKLFIKFLVSDGGSSNHFLPLVVFDVITFCGNDIFSTFNVS